MRLAATLPPAPGIRESVLDTSCPTLLRDIFLPTTPSHKRRTPEHAHAEVNQFLDTHSWDRGSIIDCEVFVRMKLN